MNELQPQPISHRLPVQPAPQLQLKSSLPLLLQVPSRKHGKVPHAPAAN